MLKRFLVSAAAVAVVSAASAQTTTIAAFGTVPTAGADFGSFSRGSAALPNGTHWSYNLRISTPTGQDWTGSEVSVDVVGNGSIWHASNERQLYAPVVIGQDDNDPNRLPGDPDDLNCYRHNLQTPGAAGTATNTLASDTFFSGPGNAGGVFTVDPQFASPGPTPAPNTCPVPNPVSTATRLRGLNPANNEIALAWYDTASTPSLTNVVIARLTFVVAAGEADLVVLNAGDPAPANKRLFATLRGKSTTNINSDGTVFGWDIYQTPEPSTLALLALGGLAGLIRRR